MMHTVVHLLARDIWLNVFTCGSRSTCCNFLNLNLNLLQEKKSGVSMKLESSVNEFQVQIRSFCEIANFC